MKREHLLLRVVYQMLKEQETSPYVISMLEQSNIWDGVECDGYCLMEDIEDLLIKQDVDPNEKEVI